MVLPLVSIKTQEQLRGHFSKRELMLMKDMILLKVLGDSVVMLLQNLPGST
jgi:hypothetical protein